MVILYVMDEPASAISHTAVKERKHKAYFVQGLYVWHVNEDEVQGGSEWITNSAQRANSVVVTGFQYKNNTLDSEKDESTPKCFF